MKDGKRVYIFLGQEDHLKEKALKGLKTSLLEGSTAEFNYHLFYGNETGAKEILASASILPFSGGSRLVVVKKAEKLEAEDKRLFAEYLAKPNQKTCLVLDSQDESILEIAPASNQYVETVRFDKVPDFKLRGWISETLSAMGKTADKEALDLLKELFGGDQGLLRLELEKLAVFVGTHPRITLTDVETVVGEGPISTMFELTDAIGARDAKKAIRVLRRLLSQPRLSSRYGGIVGAIAWHLRRLLKARPQGDYASASGKMTARELTEKLEMLLKADLDIKLDRMDSRTALETVVVRLCLG